MRTKRLLAALLAAALLASLTVLPAGAAQSSFTDITDETTAVNADILRLMGIVSGVGDNRFEPDGTLTRAQFCTMVVRFLQKQDEANRYATRTIFSDVGSGHWARSYINFAASYSVGSGSSSGGDSTAAGTPLVAGVGDGKFMPDSQITLAEAVTILLRALDYTSQQAGSVWPQGYLDLAKSIGLSDGLPAGAASPITRAQAAQLFMNALKCKKAGGEVYYKSLGSKSEKAIILEVNAATDDGSAQGALRTVIGADVQAYLPAHGDGSPVSLLNRRGELVLNDQNEIVTFLPDNSNRVTLVLNKDAKLSGFQDGATQYNIAKTTPVYVADSERDSGYQDSESYEKAYEKMEAGTQITMYTENGKVTTIFAAIPGTAISADAVVVMGRANAATFHQLTGGRTDFSLRRGKETIHLSDLEDYDVVTYDKVTNTLLVSDLHLPCVYGGASPSVQNPETIKVLDSNEFEVLESAWDTVNQFKPGENVVLLLTADGKVAGMASSDSKLRSTAVGEVSGGSVTVFMPNGKELELKGKLSGATTDGTVVTVTGTQDTLSASRLVQRRPSGDYRVSAARLDKYVVASDVRIYEQTSGGVMTPVDIKELPAGSIAARQVASYRLTSSNIVDVIVLEDVTGNAYQYGMMISRNEVISEAYEDEDGNLVPAKTRVVWELHRGSGDIKFAATVSYNGKSGDLVGVITGRPRSGVEGVTLTTMNRLTEIKGVKPSDFFESDERPYVTISGRTYPVADDVETFYSKGGNRPSNMQWQTDGTGAKRLEFIKGYSEELTLYVDPVGQQVRIIRAN